MQPFGRNRYGPNIGFGLCPFGGEGAGSPSNTVWPGPRPTCMLSFILIRQTVWPQYTNVTDRQTVQDRTDRQRSDSIGRTVLQTVAQKSPINRHLGNIAQLCRAISSQLRHVSTIEKNLLNSHVSPTCPHNMVNFGPLAAEIGSGVWGTPANFNGFRFASWQRYCTPHW